MKHLKVSQQVTTETPFCIGMADSNPARQGLVTHRKRVLRSQQRCWHEA